jgi:3-isopropylmalate/(R)-2-methylmalate dehydratase small subunit
VVAESYARIFFRNCVATGELYPVEATERLVDGFRTGDEAVLDLDAATLTNRRTGAVHRLRPLGDAGPVISAGGLFAYARQTGMIAAAPSQGVDAAGAGPSAGPDD